MARPADVLLPAASTAGVPLHLIGEGEGLETLGAAGAAFGQAQGFKGQAGQVLLLSDDAGRIAVAAVGTGKAPVSVPALRALPARLPPGDYALAALPDGVDPAQAALAWAQGAYAFDRFKAERDRPRPRLVLAPGVDRTAVLAEADACALARDLVNTPASHMGPAELEAAARAVAETGGAVVAVFEGEALLAANHPAIHAVGRAAAPDRAPRLIELSWTGPGAGPDAPLVALVGKGVTFDTGGLDIKPSAGMRLMKKDMGGAAHVLALAQMVMAARLPVRLAVLTPVAENAISGDAVRPGDVLATRKGLSVEVGNTDAEGRLILADALTRAGELGPDLTLDFATLTGAARVALGPEVIPFYTADEALAAGLARAAAAVADPLWRMPLWAGYEDSLSSDVADLKNDPDAWAQAGSVTAALFLQRFRPEGGAWAHFDIYAWNPRARPGWPVGGEAQAIRAAFRLLQDRYGAGG